MRLHRMRLAAFGPFGAAQEVDFDALNEAGLFLLHGPTGAGKTSVLDAVCYALYGSVPGARQHQANQAQALRSDHAAPTVRTEVSLELSVAGRRLEITRQPPWVRPKKRGTGFTTEKAQTWLREYDAVAGAWKDLSRSHQEVGEEIGQLLGMSKEQFCQVVLLPQGEFARFLRADAEARGKLLGRLFDTRRFAAVEAALAERRRGTEARVRAADDRLLAVAHRVQQAAGDAAELPLPEPAPGEPGLAEALLGWAAVARSGARERLDVARALVVAAESGRAAAQVAFDDVRETERLQRRHHEARQRAARLEETAEAYRAAVARLERGRKAETVAPALALHAAAETEHRTAVAEEQRALRLLPEEYADAGAQGLTAAARRATEELGALEAARRAEQRITELTAERARLDAEERADEEALQEATAWLDGWEERRDALREQIERAQEAATLAEQLAGRLDQARARSHAARERDHLTARAAQAHQDALTAREHAAAAHEHWLALKEQRLRGIAAELAAGLTPGEPCAVCGGTDHPAPARPAEGHVGRREEESALAAHRAAQDRSTAADTALADVRATLAAAEATAGEASTAELAEEEADLARRHTAARDRAAALHAARETLARAESEHDRRATARQEAATRAASRDSLREALTREEAALQGELARAGIRVESENESESEAASEAEGEGAGTALGAAAGSANVPGAAAAGASGGTGERDGSAGGGAWVEGGYGGGAAAGSVNLPGTAASGASGGTSERDGSASGDAWAEGGSGSGTGAGGGRDGLRGGSGSARTYGSFGPAGEGVWAEGGYGGGGRRAGAGAGGGRDAARGASGSALASGAGGPGRVAARAAQLERQVRLLTEAADAVRAAEEAARRLKDADARLADAAYRAGFATPRAAAEAALDDAAHRQLQHRIDVRQQEEAEVRAVFAEPGTAAAAQLPPADAAAARAAVEAAELRLRAAVSARSDAERRCAELDRLARQAAIEARELGPLRAEHERVARMAGLAAGTSAENERRMRLESYVLAARLEQVAAAATVRLQRMSAGRYTLVHSDDRTGRGRSGLGLHVVDAWTGSERDTATLSGGETFFASLALALGLADVVSDEAGGVRLDTLFIDEGFGSLDDQTLDEVLDVLDSLRERDRSVGIVSHVADLRRRVHAQLEVVKGRGGSVVRQRDRGRRGSGEE
ncbi:AAA family ATPase [Streptomyces sp. NPDC002851]